MTVSAKRSCRRCGGHHERSSRCPVYAKASIGLIYLLFSSILCSEPAQAAAPQTIRWRVENPFRLFLDPVDTARHRSVFEQLNKVERTHPILAAERRLAEAAPRGWAETVVSSLCWSQTKRQNQCDQVNDYAFPVSHRVVAEFKAGTLATATCTWIIANRQPTQSPPTMTRTAPCDEQITFDVPFPNGARVSVAASGQGVNRPGFAGG